MMTIYFDIIFFFGGWLLGQYLLQGYEAHVAYSKRAIKLVILSIIFFSIYFFVGRELFYSVLVLMAVGITVLHGYWFHYHHGIHWRTAEPREKYLDLIGKNKREG